MCDRSSCARSSLGFCECCCPFWDLEGFLSVNNGGLVPVGQVNRKLSSCDLAAHRYSGMGSVPGSLVG